MSYNNSLLGVSYPEFSVGYLEKSLLRISLSHIFEEDPDFFDWNPSKHPWKILGLFVERSQEQRTNFGQFRLHFFRTILHLQNFPSFKIPTLHWVYLEQCSRARKVTWFIGNRNQTCLEKLEWKKWLIRLSLQKISSIQSFAGSFVPWGFTQK